MHNSGYFELSEHLAPCICSCMLGPAQFPVGWSKPQASWSSSSGKWLRPAAPAPPAHSSDSVHQRCLLAHRWTVDALLPSAHSELFHSAKWKELLIDGLLLQDQTRRVENISWRKYEKLKSNRKQKSNKKGKIKNISPHHPISHSEHRALQWQMLVCRSLLVQWGHRGNPAWSGPPPQGPPHTDQAPHLTLQLELCTSTPSPTTQKKTKDNTFAIIWMTEGKKKLYAQCPFIQ